MSLPVSFIKQNNVEYEVQDKYARSQIANLGHNRKFLFLGDSYYLGINNVGWADYVIQYLGLTSDEYVKASADDVLGNPQQVSTPGFSASTGAHRSFRTILEAVYTRIGNSVAESITDVVVAGGYNDIDKTDIDTGIASYATYAKSHFPNADLWVAEIGNDGGKDRVVQRSKIYNNVTPAYQNESIKNGMRYIQNAELILSKSTLFITDSPAHPTADGYKMIGMAIANALVGGSIVNPYYSDTPIDVRGSQWTIAGGGITVKSPKYGYKRIATNGDHVVFSSSSLITLTPQQRMISIPISCPAIMPTEAIRKNVAVLFASSSGYKTGAVPASLFFAVDSNYDTYLGLDFRNQTVEDFTNVEILGFEIDYPCYVL